METILTALVSELRRLKSVGVKTVNLSPTALDSLRREKPRLVLLDVMMPKKTGFEVCQELRADETIKDTLVLMLTAKGRETDVAKGLGVGADAYMTKPFATKDLVAKVRELLAGT